MTDMPARRQEEARSWRIALTCPVNRPAEIPNNGVYHPLPPNFIRERNVENEIVDNYIHKTYIRKGKLYPEGIWVLDIHDYKTRKKYGPQSIVIKNRQFSDGSFLYDYIEHYLYGLWYPKEGKRYSPYTWWDSSLIGQKGLWISLGRASFEPFDACIPKHNKQDDFWTWGYFFTMPRTGKGYSASDFEAFFSTAAHKVIGKEINPHIIRDMWATWSYQVGLTDAQRESLAYAMGMDIKTLENIYEHCSPDEKRRPIEDVIDTVLFGELENEYHQSNFYIEKLAQEVLGLSKTDQLHCISIISSQQHQ